MRWLDVCPMCMGEGEILVTDKDNSTNIVHDDDFYEDDEEFELPIIVDPESGEAEIELEDIEVEYHDEYGNIHRVLGKVVAKFSINHD